MDDITQKPNNVTPFGKGSADAPAPPTANNIDILFTKIAVDLQNIHAESQNATIRDNLRLVCDAISVDAAGLVLLKPGDDLIEQVIHADGSSRPCQMTNLLGRSLGECPWVSARLAHLRILEIDNTVSPPSYMQADADLLAESGIGAVLLLGIKVADDLSGFLALCSTRPRAWDTNTHLILKLVGSSLASGLQRLHINQRVADERIRNQLARYSANDGLWDFNLQNNDAYFSPRWKRMLGFDESSFSNDLPDWRSLVHPDDLAKVQASMRDHMNGKTDIFESQHRMRHRNGSWRWVLSRAKALIGEDGRVQRLVGVELDITERKLYEDALFQEKERAQITLQSIGDGVITTDSRGIIEYMNPKAEAITGWTLAEAAGSNSTEVFTIYHEETTLPMGDPVQDAIERKRLISSTPHRPVLLLRKDGEQLYVNSTAAPIRDGKGLICGGVLVFQDVTEARDKDRKLRSKENSDILTGLLNRKRFEEAVQTVLVNLEEGATEAQSTVLFLDIDQFKMINDSCGHAAGDELLVEVAAKLKIKNRWGNEISRLGGDEFAILLRDHDLASTVEFAEDLRQTIENIQFEWHDKKFNVATSIGVIPITKDINDVASIMSAAESACSAAKEAGRNRVYVFQANDIDLIRRQREMQWAAKINLALEEDRFEIYRQTIMPLTDQDEGEHYELLLRMRDEQGNMVAPDLFIAAAERYSLMPKIDRWVIRNAFKWLLDTPAELENLSLCAINLSGQSLGDDQFLPFVIEEFNRTGLDPTRICFEITETAAVSSFSHANTFIRDLKALGCQFALDDFGTGLSSFSYLKHFPVDYLKIDGSFVKGILTDAIDREMVRSINEIGHLTNKRTIAEFAENDEIIQALREMGVDYAQGYGISKPAPVLASPLPPRPPED